LPIIRSFNINTPFFCGVRLPEKNITDGVFHVEHRGLARLTMAERGAEERSTWNSGGG
jgi:hypothetical protein